jgi:phosphatidylglycerol:prolipoprotein diacylglycerol transferase
MDALTVAALACAGGVAGAFALDFAAHGGARVGFAFYGGFAGGALTALACRRLAPFAAFADAAAPPLALAHAVGRVGCWLAGCCFGRATALPIAAVGRHPVQLYEALGLVAIAAATWRARRPFARYVVAYALLRLATEPLRGDDRGALVARGLAPSSACAALALVAAAVVRYRSREGER